MCDTLRVSPFPSFHSSSTSIDMTNIIWISFRGSVETPKKSVQGMSATLNDMRKVIKMDKRMVCFPKNHFNDFWFTLFIKNEI